jgi:pyridoxine 5-phosphate synthase
MAPTEEMVAIALDIKPDYVTIVPEKREEVTTEGGLDVAGDLSRMKHLVEQLQGGGIPVSWFIDPDATQIQAAADTGAKLIELHTGRYAEAKTEQTREAELAHLKESCDRALSLGLRVNAGHGLTYYNVAPIAAIPGMEELNIGHSIISRAVLVGLERAVREMKSLIKQ